MIIELSKLWGTTLYGLCALTLRYGDVSKPFKTTPDLWGWTAIYHIFWCSPEGTHWFWPIRIYRNFHAPIFQWPFQDPKLEVPSISKAYFLGLCKGISQQNMARNMIQYLHIKGSWRSPIEYWNSVCPQLRQLYIEPFTRYTTSVQIRGLGWTSGGFIVRCHWMKPASTWAAGCTKQAGHESNPSC